MPLVIYSPHLAILIHCLLWLAMEESLARCFVAHALLCGCFINAIQLIKKKKKMTVQRQQQQVQAHVASTSSSSSTSAAASSSSSHSHCMQPSGTSTSSLISNTAFCLVVDPEKVKATPSEAAHYTTALAMQASTRCDELEPRAWMAGHVRLCGCRCCVLPTRSTTHQLLLCKCLE